MSEEIANVINGFREPIMSAWTKAANMTGKSDFMAIVETGKESSILVMSRSTGLEYLKEKGVDTEIPALVRMKNPAVGMITGSTAIWVVLFHDGVCHVAQIVQMPMNAGGTRDADIN
jgi:hypothetical protein